MSNWEKLLENWHKAEAESDAETDFEPLDDTIASDSKLLQSDAMRLIVRRCKDGGVGLPEGLVPEGENWRRGLNEYRLASYCGSISGLFQSALLKSRRPPANAAGNIRSFMENPYFEIFAERGSELAQEASREGRLIYSAKHIGRHVALRAEEPIEWGDIAWRSIAACLPECEFSPLPGLDTLKVNGAIELRLQPDFRNSDISQLREIGAGNMGSASG